MEKNNKKKGMKEEKTEPKATSIFSSEMVSEQELDYKTRTVLLLDSRNDLIAFFFGGLDVMGANYKPKGKDKFAEFVYATCRGFIETVREKSMAIMTKHSPKYGIGDIIKNPKGNTRMIINMFEDKDKKFTYSWVDPNDAKAPMGVCQANSMQSWVEKR